MKKSTICILSAVLMSSMTLTKAQNTNSKSADSTKGKAIDEIVLVGYGKQKKGNVSGSIATINPKLTLDRPVTSLLAGVQGLVPGLNIKSAFGDVGTNGASINIRGKGIGGNEPLFIVDGVIVAIADFVRLSPNDIENISVLKDGAAAIYGTRAGGGVILVETKRGGGGKMKIDYNMYNGWQNQTYLPKYVRAVDYMKLRNEAAANAGISIPFSQDQIDVTAAGTDPDRYPDTDWYGNTYRKLANILNNELSVSGGDKIRYFTSLGYLNQESLSPTREMDRISFRSNVSAKLSKSFNINTNISFIRQDVEDTGAGINTLELARINPTMNIRQSNGWWGSVNAGTVNNTFARTNPIRNNLEGGDSKSFDQKLIMALNANYEPIKGLNINGSFTYNNWNARGGSFTNTLPLITNFLDQTKTVPNTGRPVNSYSESWQTADQIMAQALVSYEKKISGHFFKILGGYSYEDWTRYNISGSKSNIPKNGLHSLSALSTIDGTLDVLNSNTVQYALQSVFGRLNYSFREKYFIEGILRADGSSRFPKNNQWGYFPSVMASWRMDKENFMQNLHFINMLKPRVSYGEMGTISSNLGYYDRQDLLNSGSTVLGNQIVSTIVPGQVGFEGFGWETIVSKNIGLDGALFDNSFTFMVDIYDRLTKNALMNNAPPVETGVSPSEAPPLNAADVRNRGIEVTLGYTKTFKNGDFYINGNFAKNNNEITRLLDNKTTFNGYWIQQVGGSIGDFYGYKTQGLLTQADIDNKYPLLFNASRAGDIKYVDLNGDGVINADDRTVLGNDVPDFTYGLSIGGSYKNFDISIMGQGVANIKVYLPNEASWPFFNGGNVKQDFMNNHWTVDNPNPGAAFPRLLDGGGGQNVNATSDFWLFKASYFRIKNITLGYSIPKATVNAIGLSKFRIYASAENFITFRGDKRLTDFDPEMQSTRSSYPLLKTIAFGINASF